MQDPVLMYWARVERCLEALDSCRNEAAVDAIFAELSCVENVYQRAVPTTAAGIRRKIADAIVTLETSREREDELWRRWCTKLRTIDRRLAKGALLPRDVFNLRAIYQAEMAQNCEDDFLPLIRTALRGACTPKLIYESAAT